MAYLCVFFVIYSCLEGSKYNPRNFLFIMESVKLFMSNVQYEVIEVDALN